MKTRLIGFIFVTAVSGYLAQDCNFDYYPKKGGHYLFSTYYECEVYETLRCFGGIP